MPDMNLHAVLPHKTTEHVWGRVLDFPDGTRRVERVIEGFLDGWWIVKSVGERDANFTWLTEVVQIRAGEYYEVETFKGPYPSQHDAEFFQYQDSLPSYWEHGLDVYADHCLRCGNFAKVLAFDSKPFFSWRVTECWFCGVLDSRDYRKEL